MNDTVPGGEAPAAPQPAAGSSFDWEGARRAGYSDKEIVDHLAPQRNFDAAGARQAGYSDAEILRRLTEQTQRAELQTEARAANSGVTGYLGGFRRAVDNSLAFGFRDEAAAAIDASVGALFPGNTTWSQRYDRALAGDRARTQDFEQNNPGTALAGGLVGGVVNPLFRFSSIAPAARNAELAERVLRSGPARTALAGMVGGAAQGFGEGQGDLWRRLGNAASGGAMGSALGGAFGAGASVVAPLVGRLLHAVGLRNAETAADRQVLRAMDRDKVDPETLLRTPQGPGLPPPPEGLTLADTGPNMRALAGAAANSPGEAMTSGERLAEARRLARPERIAGSVDDALGGGGGTRVADEVGALQQTRRNEARPRYEASFNRITPTDAEVGRVLPAIEDRIGQDALQRGLRVIELEHVATRLRDPNAPEFNPASYGVVRGEDGSFIVQDGHRNLRLLDAVKRGYDEIVEGFRDKTSGRLVLDQYGNAVNDARAAYAAQLRDMYPRYAGALDAWGGPTRSMDAVGRGRQALRTDRDVVDRVMSDLSEGDREFFRLGVGRAITDATSDPAKAVGVARRLFEDEQMVARLRTIIPDPAVRARFMAAMEREVEMAAVERAVSPRANSHTPRVAAGQADMTVDPPGPFLSGLLAGSPVRAVTAGAGALIRRGQGMTPATADALASRLLNPDGTANVETIKRLLSRREMDRLQSAGNANLAAALLRGGGATAAALTSD